MADIAELATEEQRTGPSEQQKPTAAAPEVTSVANPRRTRLTRLTQLPSRAN